jgi:hypothetical protein
VYTPAERAAKVAAFLAKRSGRVWKKAVVRYGCRKSLADRRIRIGGRFVTAERAAEIAAAAAAALEAGGGTPADDGAAGAPAPPPPPALPAGAAGRPPPGAAGGPPRRAVVSPPIAGAYVPVAAVRADAVRDAQTKVEARARAAATAAAAAAAAAAVAAVVHAGGLAAGASYARPRLLSFDGVGPGAAGGGDPSAAARGVKRPAPPGWEY